MSKFAPHHRSTNQARATSSTVCQKCLSTGHFIFECKNERPYVTRPSRTQQLDNPKLLAKLRAEGKPSVELPEEFKKKTGTADKILEAKEKERLKDVENTLPKLKEKEKEDSRPLKRRKRAASTSSSSSSSESESESDSGSESDSSSGSSNSDSSSSASESDSRSSTSYQSRDRKRKRRSPQPRRRRSMSSERSLSRSRSRSRESRGRC